MTKERYSFDELCLVWLDSFLGVDRKHKLELYNLINGKTEIRNVILENRERIERALGAEKYGKLVSSANPTYLDFVISGLARRGLTAVTLQSSDYPETLKNTNEPPVVLYCRGNIGLLKENCFSIVGSRKSLPLSIKLAGQYTDELSRAGFVPVTGIAEGVDKAVIDAALKGNGKVISVLPCGFDNIYPKSHASLVDEISKSGLVITEYMPEVVARVFTFPSRNRIIAGLSRGTLVVSAGVKSGTFHTANYALEYGRDLFVIPYSVGVSSGVGCNALIKSGASLTDSPSDILELYGIVNKEKEAAVFDDTEREIIKALVDGALHVEKIAEALNTQTFMVMPTLSKMEMKGFIVKIGVNIYGLARTDLEE